MQKGRCCLCPDSQIRSSDVFKHGMIHSIRKHWDIYDYPLAICDTLLLNMPVDIVDLPKCGGLFHSCFFINIYQRVTSGFSTLPSDVRVDQIIPIVIYVIWEVFFFSKHLCISQSQIIIQLQHLVVVVLKRLSWNRMQNTEIQPVYFPVFTSNQHYTSVDPYT